MAIKGLEGISAPQLAQQLQQGGRFVVYEYVFSVLIMSFRRASDIYYIPPGTSAASKGWPYTLLSLVVGWWGIPWGFIWTPMAIYRNLQGGRDVTEAVVDEILARIPDTVQTAAAAAVQAPDIALSGESQPQWFGAVTFLSGPLTGQRITLPTGGAYLGSNPGPGGIVIPDARVVPQHCWIGPGSDGSPVVIDLGSANGTYVVTAAASTRVQQAPLQTGDQVYLGPDGGIVCTFEHLSNA